MISNEPRIVLEMENQIYVLVAASPQDGSRMMNSPQMYTYTEPPLVISFHTIWIGDRINKSAWNRRVALAILRVHSLQGGKSSSISRRNHIHGRWWWWIGWRKERKKGGREEGKKGRKKERKKERRWLVASKSQSREKT